MKNLCKTLSLLVISVVNVLFADDLALTVTNADIALVRETRQLQLEKGAHRFDLQDIPARIQPSSVLIESEDNSFVVLEQNYEYDLVNVDKVLNKSLNKNVRIVHPEFGDLTGELLSVSTRFLMLKNMDKQLQIVPRSDDLQVFIEDYSKGEGFITRPTLVWQVKTKQAGKHSSKISYLTGGLDWRADYVGRLSQNDKLLILASWVTVDNKSGKTFKDARLKLMAGDLNLVKPKRAHRQMEADNVMAMMAKPSFEEKAFFEYHLYSLDRKTTLLNNQVKQIQLFSDVSTPVNKKYIVDSNKSDKVNVSVLLKNSKDNQLGFALPAGKIRLYKADGEDIEFIGEDMIDHTPEDEELSITVGQAFDIVSERTVLKTERPSKRSSRLTVEYTIRNHKDSRIQVEVIERLASRQQSTLLSSSLPATQKLADRFTFEVPVPAKGEYKLNIQYVISW